MIQLVHCLTPFAMKSQREPVQQEQLKTSLFFYGSQENVLEVKVFEPEVDLTAIPESLIHQIWQQQRFDATDLRTSTGESICIVNPGHYNLDEGPDFLDATIELDRMTWHGDVEIHRTSKDWIHHAHQKNPRYNSVVLHVTLLTDETTGRLTRQDQSILPELALYDKLQTALRPLLYAHRTLNKSTLACADSQSTLQDDRISGWLAHLGTRRLMRKKQQIERTYIEKPNLEDILHELVFAGLGYAKNTIPMRTLAQRIPLDLAQQLDDVIDLEALHLGTAGLLPTKRVMGTMKRVDRAYAKELAKRYKWLSEAFNITPMPGTAWRFFRLRPANFPTVRIVQAAALFHPGRLLHFDGLQSCIDLFDTYYNAESLTKQVLTLMHNVLKTSTSDFWRTHYRFEKPGKTRAIRIGAGRIQKLLLNAVFPVLLVKADQQSRPEIEHKILQCMFHLKSEKDTIVNLFHALESQQANAGISQGFHELHEFYCTQGRCLDCAIGLSIINHEARKSATLSQDR